jgi:hypothetical protein
MIKGKQKQPTPLLDKPNFNYRKLDALNQSMLKLFDSDPVKFYDEFKLGKKRKEKKNVALMIGDLVDFYLLECAGDETEFEKRFDEKFALFSGVKGTGQVFILADYLFEETENCINEAGEMTCSFETRFAEAVKRVRAEEKYKGKDDDKILEDFLKNGKDYFDIRMNAIGRTVVDVSIVDKARTVAIKLKKDPFSSGIFSGHDEEHEFVTHFPIEFTYRLDKDRSIVCKAELDMMLIDHENKVIQPMDLKTTYDNESFDFMYIKNSYYLQNAFYVKATEEWAKLNGMKDYHVLPMKFVVGDTSSNNRRPLVYTTNSDDIEAGMKGFTLKGNYYRGVEDLVEDIAWAEQNDEWSCSREAFNKKGQLKLSIKYE